MEDDSNVFAILDHANFKLPYIKRGAGDQPVVLARMMTRFTGAVEGGFVTRREWRSPKRMVQLLMMSVT
jgi:hypothetical protein